MHRLIASILFAGALLFSGAGLVFAQTPDIQGGLCAGANFDLQSGAADNADCSSGDDATQKLNDLVRKLINLTSVVVGIVAVIMIIVGGLRYITSGGNDSNVTGAKNTILYAIIGLIIVALSQVIVRVVLSNVTSG